MVDKTFALHRDDFSLLVQRKCLVLNHFHDVEEVVHFSWCVRLQQILFGHGRYAGVTDVLQVLLQIALLVLHIILIVNGALQDEVPGQVL